MVFVHTSGSLIYLETIRDAKLGNTESMGILERYTVVHESGHQFLLQHEDGWWPPGDRHNPADDYIMTNVTDESGMAPNIAFSPVSRDKVRCIAFPPQP